MIRRTGPTQKRVKELLRFEPLTGKFFWRSGIKRGVGFLKKEIPAGYYGRLYVEIGLDSVVYLGHQIAWLYMTGDWPVKIDHRDTNGKNNRWRNLRLASDSQNLQNARKRVQLEKPCTSKYKGVFWRKDIRKWCAQICIYGKRTHLGVFMSETAASRAYRRAAKKHFGEFARAA